ncbi:MAG: MFS transporter [Phocaeicola sp.]
MGNHISVMKFRLIIMNFLQFAVWGTYLTSLGTYLSSIGMPSDIGIFYAMQGIVSLFMPAIMGVIADRWVPAQKLLGFCHFVSAIFMIIAGYYGLTTATPEFVPLFTLYSLGVAFYMPTLALSNSVAYTALDSVKLDPIVAFPPIRVFGTVGFICAMLLTDVLGFQTSGYQFFLCALFGLILSVYSFTLPACAVSKDSGEKKTLVDALGLRAFALFKQKKMAVFFIFSMLLGVSLQITNGFANPFITSFGAVPEYQNTFGVQHANVLISLSQVSETLCVLLIPFALKKFGIKQVMLIAMLAWVLRFGLFGLGNPGSGVWMFLLSMIVYGIAFDFFNVSGSLFVNNETDLSIRSSAQGLFMIMTNGIGATVGTLGAQFVVNHFVDHNSTTPQLEGWSMAWFTFAAYALVVAVLFAIIFKYKHNPNKI